MQKEKHGFCFRKDTFSGNMSLRELRVTIHSLADLLPAAPAGIPSASIFRGIRNSMPESEGAKPAPAASELASRAEKHCPRYSDTLSSRRCPFGFRPEFLNPSSNGCGGDVCRGCRNPIGGVVIDNYFLAAMRNTTTPVVRNTAPRICST